MAYKYSKDNCSGHYYYEIYAGALRSDKNTGWGRIEYVAICPKCGTVLRHQQASNMLQLQRLAEVTPSAEAREEYSKLYPKNFDVISVGRKRR